MPLAFTKSGDIVLLQMDGMMTRDEVAKALDMAEAGSKKLFDLQRKAFEKEYAEPLGKRLSLKEEESKVDIHKL
jgi:exosome complex component RRP41